MALALQACRKQMDSRTHALHARCHVASGDAVGAAEHLTGEMAEGDPLLLLTIAEIQLRGGHLDPGIALAEQVLAAEPSSAGSLVRLGLDLAARRDDAGFLLVEMGANAWTMEGRWADAAAAFEALIALRPHYVPAAVRLREIEASASSVHAAAVLPFRRLRTA